MKKQLVLISLILAMFTSFAQDVQDETTSAAPQDTTVATNFSHNRVNIHFGGAFTNNIYKRIPAPEIRQTYSLGALFELGYSYFFNQHWGIGIGVGVSNIHARANLNLMGVQEDAGGAEYVPEGYTPSNYDLLYTTNDLYEHQYVTAIEVPLTAQFEWRFNNKIGLWAAMGLKGYFPVYNHSKMADGELITKGYDEYLDVLYQDMEQHGFTTYDFEGGDGKTKLRCSLDFQSDFGAIFALNNKVDFYTGLFCSIGFLDILPKDENKHTFIENNTDLTKGIKYNGLLGSDYHDQFNKRQENIDNGISVRTKWHLLQVGVKVGIHINADLKSEKSLKKRFYEEMMKKAATPCVEKTTEVVYIIPQCPEGYDDDDEGDDDGDGTNKKLSKKDKEDIGKLAESLSKIKILFDLDKDIPKITEQNDHIDNAVKVLKGNKNLYVIIEGYTCDLGTEEHNRDLANRRAESIKRIFIEKGVPENQIKTVSYTAKDKENKNNITETSREEHRAAIFRIMKK